MRAGGYAAGHPPRRQGPAKGWSGTIGNWWCQDRLGPAFASTLVFAPIAEFFTAASDFCWTSDPARTHYGTQGPPPVTRGMDDSRAACVR